MASVASVEARWLLRIAVGCAGVMTWLAVSQFIESRPEAPIAAEAVPRAVAIDNWADLMFGGHDLGPANAPVVIVEFIDFECPYCRQYALDVLPAIEASYPTEVKVLVRHFPLPQHRFATLAAAAAICAGRQGRFRTMYDLLYAVQDSIGLLPWQLVAERGGVSALDDWEECLVAPGVRAEIEAERELALRSGATGTPTIVVNGLRYDRPPREAELRAVIDSVLGR